MNRSVLFSWSIASSLLFGCAGDPPANPRSNQSGVNGANNPQTSPSGGSSNGNSTTTGNSSSNSPGSSSSSNGSAGSSSSSSSTASNGNGSGGSGSNNSGDNSSSSNSSSGGSSASSSGTVDCKALPPPADMDDMIADFEDGTGATLQVGGRGGGFYMFNDGTGTQVPSPGPLPDATKTNRCDSTYALCTSGKNFTMWGAGLGTDLGQVAKGADGGMGAKSAYDASEYKGVSFWAKTNTSSSVAVRVSIKDKNTAPEGGVCDAKVSSGATACNDDWGKALSFTADWKPYTVLFNDLRQAGWGAPYPAFDMKNAYSVQLQVNKGIDFDLCIDDVAFVR